MDLSCFGRMFKPCEDIAPLKLEIAYLKKQLSELRLKDNGNDSTFIFDEASIKTINVSDLHRIVKAAFPNAALRVADDEYQYTSLSEVQRWASFDPTNELTFRKDIMDCDKFALTDMADFKKENNYQLGNAVFGECWGGSENGYHAWNCVLAHTHTGNDMQIGLYFLEPQSDLIFSIHNKTIHDYRPDYIRI